MQASNSFSLNQAEGNGFFSKLRKNQPGSYYTGLVSLIAIPVFLLLSTLDPRTLLGLNVWIKPMKFAVSIWIFLWTMGWFLAELKEFPSFASRLEKYFIVSLMVELVLITVQAGRGVISHFNQSTALDGAIYSIMGLFIFPMIPVAILMDRKFKLLSSKIDERLLIGIRFSLWIFAVASIFGVLMSARLAHSVGVPDGGPGLPFVNWSKNGGDIRIAHFAGIHALQVLPIFGFISIKQNWGRVSIFAVSIGYALLVAAVFINAILGRPLY
ncbi:hypothetical protein EHQ53_06165 [Leptospira langatensis]|uniref:Uncharacterized protein n=1 Tax=Leptospira langatensis TaxID=2484983 RepID=A0A5F1ZW58_9LEPT|nr:hypothetical protein [Leptospira langatensis]TGK03039.1 hypothetical protein EHO57_07000 [Leptospira langatensis]TGL41795.1 hypothetical protein EHQ53_06165 [Leptospira langatensis]